MPKQLSSLGSKLPKANYANQTGRRQKEETL
jgi:hypothetical protein